MKTPAIAISIFTLFSSTVVATDNTVSAPMHITNKGHAYIYADVDSVKKYPMVIDTGANIGILPTTFKSKLKLSNKELQTQLVTGGTGELEMQFVNINQTNVAGQKQANLNYLIRDLDKLKSKSDQIPGIIGHNYLVNYCVEFDFTNKSFNLTKQTCTDISTKGLREVPFKIRDGFIWTTARFNNVDVDALLDTGAHHSFINTPLLKTLNAVKVGKKESFSALTDHEQNRTELRGVSYMLANHNINENLMYASDMHVFSTLGYENTPFLLLGLDYFKQGKLVIDYSNQRIYF